MKTKDRIIQGISVTSLILWVILSFFNTLKNFDFNLLTASLIIPIVGFGYQQVEKYINNKKVVNTTLTTTEEESGSKLNVSVKQSKPNSGCSKCGRNKSK